MSRPGETGWTIPRYTDIPGPVAFTRPAVFSTCQKNQVKKQGPLPAKARIEIKRNLVICFVYYSLPRTPAFK
jgi:hypothetical protein